MSSPTNAAQNSFQATNLLIVRHGQRDASGSRRIDLDPPLSALGRRQASAVATALHSGPAPHAVYSSPLARALETATVIADRIGLKVSVDERLAEIQVDLDAETSPPAGPTCWRGIPTTPAPMALRWPSSPRGWRTSTTKS